MYRICPKCNKFQLCHVYNAISALFYAIFFFVNSTKYTQNTLKVGSLYIVMNVFYSKSKRFLFFFFYLPYQICHVFKFMYLIRQRKGNSPALLTIMNIRACAIDAAIAITAKVRNEFLPPSQLYS